MMCFWSLKHLFYIFLNRLNQKIGLITLIRYERNVIEIGMWLANTDEASIKGSWPNHPSDNIIKYTNYGYYVYDK